GKANGYSIVTSAELREAFEKTSQQDLGWFFTKWVYGIGNPVLNVLWSRNNTKVTMRIEQIQDSAKIGYFRLPLIIEPRAPKTGKIERMGIMLDSTRITEVTFEDTFIPDTLVIDPDGAVIKKINGSVKLGIIPLPT